MTSQSSPIRPNTGGELQPSDIVGRDELVEELLSNGQSVRIEDPRRMGKTCVLRLLASHHREERPIIHVSVQGFRTADEIVLDIGRALNRHIGRFARFKGLKGLFATAEVGAGPVTFTAALEKQNAMYKLEQLLGTLSGQFGDGELIIAIDELPWAISNIARNPEPGHGPSEASALLQSLQRLRAGYPDIRWVVAGSIGFHHVLRQAGETNAVLTGLTPMSCGPLLAGPSHELASRLLLGAGLERGEAINTAISETSGRIPFIAHHLVDLLAQHPSPSPDVVSEVFDAFARDRQRSAELTHLLQRLDQYMDRADARIAESCLDACATAGTSGDGLAIEDFADLAPSADGDQLRRILHWLEDDHYLISTTSGYRWRYDVLRRVWVTRRR